ncbi:ABC transporter ATP-binding protein [Anaerocolumna sp. MB42-C2]|uniref:ABC transporter ATP-binding protein n=1 Tax=Anaerocolumna sp. MB42-C2 TaxID=3070997 RepID=UPI0027E1CB4B|nr:ABC transporter ATP-binding protein [Anaerocolumna sp. MB42-C2]WMJ85526.1 ABC transporter ATP-binding protein [Anaerocolumna sp. MB42-C2]
MDKAEKYLKMDYQLLESPKVNDINSKIWKDNNWGSGFYNLSYYLRLLLDNLFGFIIGVIMFIPLLMIGNGYITSIFLLLLLIFALVMALINSKVIQKKITELLNSPNFNIPYYAYFFWTMPINHILKTARIYKTSEILKDYIDKDNNVLIHFYKTFTKHQIKSGFISAISNGVLTVSAYLFVIVRAAAGAFPVGDIVRYAGTIYNTANNFFGLSSSLSILIDQTDRLQSTLEFMEIPNVLYRGTIPVEKRNDNDYLIEFHNVSFKYPGSDKYSLKNFSMKLNIGQRLAIVGMNGSGKTTMIKLLCRLYDPTEGKITLNGIDIRKYNYEEYMHLFSVVFQDFKLYSFKLSENIACSTAIDKKRAEYILHEVGISERYKKMEKKLDTYLYNNYDKGVEISGGEAQKIALARALYKNAPFILLDEPTAALDPISEFDIYSKFNEIVGEKTAIYISHRLSSCRFCDDIAVFHEGELIQRGNHNTLIADENGKYYELWNAQAQYYTESKAV